MTDKIRLQFMGAAGTVTGSRTLLETDKTKISVDAGLYQGGKKVEDRNYAMAHDDFSALDGVVLTHSHLDHCGLLPLMVKNGFEGFIYCPEAAVELLSLILLDSGRIQEHDFGKISKRRRKKYSLSGPLYTEADAQEAIKYIKPVEYNEYFQLGCFKIQYLWAGHILGSAYVELNYKDKCVLFSGDIGPKNNLLHVEKVDPPKVDFAIMESTYGERSREKEDIEAIIVELVDYVIQRKGMLIIPAFAVGRTQQVLYYLFLLKSKNLLPNVPIYLDSPMASHATDIYINHSDHLKKEIVESGFIEFLESDQVERIGSALESKAMNEVNGPGILVSASGMCHGGRVVHHLNQRISDNRNAVLFVGYQSDKTLGRNITEGNKRVRIFERDLPVRARIASINSFSSHADQAELLRWAKMLKSDRFKTLFINHGEEESRLVLKEKIKFFEQDQIETPKSGSIYYI